MSRWLVTQDDSQFSVGDLAELRELASSGRLAGGDMVQPPGAADWMYAAEIPELKELFGKAKAEDVDLDFRSTSERMRPMMAAVLAVVAVVGMGGMWYFFQQFPTGNERLIGEGGLSYSQMLVTEPNVVLRVDPEAASRGLIGVEKDSTLDLLAKRGDFYKARSAGGQEGWVAVDEVIPMYQLGGAEVREEHDPLYNPDRYLLVLNASWLELPETEEENITVFQFLLRNNSKYLMTDLVILATIKDARGTELELVEMPVEGVVPPNSETMVGTLGPPEDADEEAESRLITGNMLDEMAETDPEIWLRYTDGVEVEMQTTGFTEASIDILELRAVPEDA